MGALGGDSERAGFRWVALIVAAIFAVTELVCCISMKATTPSEMKTATVKEMFSSLFRNDQAMVVVGSIVLILSLIHISSIQRGSTSIACWLSPSAICSTKN